MLRVVSCLSQQHDWRLVTLAGLVCFLSGAVAIHLFQRAKEAGRSQAFRLATAGGATGLGIWSTHFIAMLSYRPGVGIAFDIPLTLLSLFSVSTIVSLGFAVAANKASRFAAPVGGAIVGVGVAVMHYLGMAAVEAPADIVWLAPYVVASVAMAVLAGAAALTVAGRGGIWATVAAAATLSLGILALHFTGMGALTWVPNPSRTISPLSFDPSSLALAIAALASAALSVALIAALYDGRLSTRAAQYDQARAELTRQSEERLRERNRHLDAALNNMSQALCMFDVERRLIVCNERYARVFGLPPALTKPGTPVMDILNYRVAQGIFPGEDADAYVRSRMAIVERNASMKTFTEFRDGRVFSVSHEPMIGGGWVATHEDVTEQVRAQRELKATQATLVEATLKAERAAADTRAAHQRLIDASNLMVAGFVLFDAEDRHVLWNRRYAETYGEAADAIEIGVHFEDIIRKAQGRGDYGDATQREEWLAARMARHRLPENTEEIELPDGRWIRIDERKTADGGSIGVRIDVTDLKRREKSFRLLFASNPLPMWVFDTETKRFLAVNDAAVEHYGYARERFLGMDVFDIRHADDKTTSSPNASGLNGETRRHVKANGEPIDVSLYSRMLTYEGRPATLAAAVDITERKRANERIQHLTTHDALTGLANREAFGRRLAEALARAGQRGVAAFCLDLDRFKEINDLHGYAVGDRVLQVLARRLQDAIGDVFIARVGGDEFNLIVTEDDQPAAAIAMADRLLAAVADEVEIDGARFKLGLSIGVAISPADGADAATLLANAEAALQRAKAEGRGLARFFEADMDAKLRERRALQNDLRAAIALGQLRVHYQPQADMAGEIFGFEALARWRHPTRGLVPPSEFIPLAEECGAIKDIGEWILREACREAASWPRPMSISVNLSPAQFRQGDLIAMIQNTLVETGLSGHRLELEITESVLIDDPKSALGILRRIKALGVKIAMDDFGTGYSSLSYLQSFPFDKIKIDRSFIANLDGTPQPGAIIRAVIGLAHGLHIPVIAEGVETKEQLAFLGREGCDEAQGYLIGRPEPIEAYDRLVGRLGKPGLRVVA